jgi:hypothetical protein
MNYYEALEALSDGKKVRKAGFESYDSLTIGAVNYHKSW